MIKLENAAYYREVATRLHQNPKHFCEAIASYEEAAKGVTKEDRQKWLAEAVLAGVKSGEKHMSDEVAAAVMFRVNVDVLAHSFAMSYFQDTPLADNEYPIVETDQRDGRFFCIYIGEAGRTVKRQRVENRTTVMHFLEKYSTPEVEYQLMDLQKGNISTLDLVNSEMSYELGQGLDGLARAILDANNSASGLRANLNLHRNLVAANIPDLNYFDFTGVDSGKDGKITVEKMKRILDHYERFSSDVEIDGEALQLRVLDISSVNKRDIWDFCDMVAGFNLSGAVQDPQNTVPGKAREEIYRSGKLEDMFGYKFLIRSHNTIATGSAYCGTNKPIGWYFNKPGMANVWREEKRRENKGMAAMERVHSFVAPAPWKYRFAKIKW